MNGINISLNDFYCEYCESEGRTLEIEGAASCYEYGSCGKIIWICMDCLDKIANKEFKIESGKLIKGR